MAVRGRDADDMIASLMQEMGQQQGYPDENAISDKEIGDSSAGNESSKGMTGNHGSSDQPLRSHRRLTPELSSYPDNSYKAGSESIWNPLVAGECGSESLHTRNDVSSRIMVPTNPRIEVIRRRVFEKFRQESQTILQEFQTKNLTFSASSSSETSSSFSKNKNRLPIPSMIDKWHMDAKLDERNLLLQKVLTTNGSQNCACNSLSAVSTSEILREMARRKEQGPPIFDPILLNRDAPSFFVETVLKPEVQKLWQKFFLESSNNSPLPPKFNKKAQQVQRGLYRLICEAIDSFETQLLQEARQESMRSISTKKGRRDTNNNKRPKISTTPTDSESSSVSLARVTFSGVTLKVHHAYLEKLQRLYDRTKDRRRRNKNAESTSDVYHRLSFEESLFCLLCRYDMIQGAGLQAGVPGSIMDVLLERFDCRMESFASPLNCRYDKFASAFVDVDAAFGSQGSFFDLPFLSEIEDSSDNDNSSDDDLHPICYEANPPFCEGIIMRMSEKIHRTLGPKQKERPIMFVVFVPAWRESECYQTLLANERLVQHLLLKQGEHWYAEGTQHRRKDSFRVASFDTSIFFYQNEAAKQLWNVQNDEGKENVILRELRKAFGQDPGSMQKEYQTPIKRRALSTTKKIEVDVPASTLTALSKTVDGTMKTKNPQAGSFSVKKQKKKKDSKHNKRKWNRQEEGKAQLDLLASLGLSSTTGENANNTKPKPDSTTQKVIQKKKKRRKK